MYRKDRRYSALLYTGGAVAVGVCLAVIAFVVWSLALRTGYRAFCMEINDAILSTPAKQCSVLRDGQACPVDSADLDYFDRFLLDSGTLVFNRRSIPPDERTITLDLGDRQLLFTGTDDNTAVNLRWITPEGERSYTVRAATVTFAQLNAYYVNLSKRSQD